MKYVRRAAVVLAGAVLLLIPVIRGLDKGTVSESHQALGARPVQTVVLDAGHGGEDGGAVSIAGAPESQINLAVVLDLRDMLALYGIDPVLLRQEDISLHDESAATLREKKRSDLKNRVAAVQSINGATLISIHQNSFTDPQYHGTQVFYAPTSGSKELAVHFQQAVCSSLQPDNSRTARPISDSVYLMEHITCPGILIECGFLTNRQEEAMLRDPSYQRKLAAVFTKAWLDLCQDSSQL